MTVAFLYYSVLWVLQKVSASLVPCFPNLCTPTLTPPPPLSPLSLLLLRVNIQLPQGWSHQSCPPTLLLYLNPSHHCYLTNPIDLSSKEPPSCLPHPGPVKSCGHQSQHVRQPVLMEHGVRATLRVAEVEASRDPPPLFFSLSLSVPPSLPVWLMTVSFRAEMDIQDYVNRK